MAETQITPIHVVELGADNTLRLPDEVAQVLRPGNRVLVMRQGDTVILKRVDLRSYLERVAAMPDDEPPPTMDEINEMVHEVRRQYAEEQ